MKYMVNAQAVGDSRVQSESYYARLGQDPTFGTMVEPPTRVRPRYKHTEYLFDPKNIIDCHVGYDENGEREIVLDYQYKQVRLKYEEHIIQSIRIRFGDNPLNPPINHDNVSKS